MVYISTYVYRKFWKIPTPHLWCVTTNRHFFVGNPEVSHCKASTGQSSPEGLGTLGVKVAITISKRWVNKKQGLGQKPMVTVTSYRNYLGGIYKKHA